MITQSKFKPAWWLRNRHAQTIWPSLFRRRPELRLNRERVELPDGDFIDLDWTEECDGPIVLMLHGLEGNHNSHYVKGIMKHLRQNGFYALVMYFRGCSGEVNRLPRAYHSGETTDVNFIAKYLKQKFPDRKLHAIGVSLGGNALLKWLGETGVNNPLDKAVAISVPFDLMLASIQLNQPESKIYQRYLVRKLQQSFRKRIKQQSLPLDINRVLACKTIWCYDDELTAPLHGFEDAADYYQKSSSRQFLKSIRIPTLIIHSQDDPFMTPETIPTEAELSSTVTLELSQHGGHVGFISAGNFGLPDYWPEKRACEFFTT